MQNSRHDISEEDWGRIEHILPGRAGGHVGVGKDNRLFINAIRYLAKTGIAWRDLPYCYGNFNSVWQRYNRWCETGVFERIAEALKDEDQEWLCVDSTCVRASVAAAAAGTKKVTAQKASTSRHWDAAEVALGPKFMPQSHRWDIPQR